MSELYISHSRFNAGYCFDLNFSDGGFSVGFAGETIEKAVDTIIDSFNRINPNKEESKKVQCSVHREAMYITIDELERIKESLQKRMDYAIFS